MNGIAVFAIAALLVSPLVAEPTSEVLRSAIEVRDATYDNSPENREFDFTATVAMPPVRNTLAVSDKSGSAIVSALSKVTNVVRRIRAGDMVRLCGLVARNPDANKLPFAQRIEILGRGDIPKPRPASPKDIMSAEFRMQFVSIRGFIADVFRDEIDPRFVFLVLTDGSSSAFLTLCGKPDAKLPAHLIGSTVEAVGVVNIPPAQTLNRKVQNVTVSVSGLNAIRVLEKAPEDPFDVPSLYSEGVEIQSYIDAGLRRRGVAGRVIAVWRNKALLWTTNGLVSRLQFSDGQHPKCGETIEAAGIPDTDFFRLNLSRAIWRDREIAKKAPEPQPERIDAEALLTDGEGNKRISAEHYGRLVTVSGVLATKPSTRLKDMRAELSCRDMRLTIDLTSAPAALEDIDIGSTLDVTGVCVIEAEVLRLQTPYPHIQDVFLALRSPSDIRVTARPPWWTPGRLLALMGALLAALVGVVVWNRTLNRLARLRGRQLMREQIEHEKAALKADERTRLAVELHDSVAQNLSGVSMQIDAALHNYKSDEKKMVANLSLASTILKSSREELRNCLWDLRSHALDEQNIGAAIRQTLKPVLDDTHVEIRFDVPRKMLSENTAHAVLRVIRELVSNSIRHGHATRIDISGEKCGSGVRFSVTDNGCGFHVSSVPGPTQGHFGLVGIKERLRDFSGTMEIESAPGKGTRTVITFS